MHEVTPDEIARTFGVSGLTFRNWLRAQKAAGHPLLADHTYRTRYRFTPDEAAQLVAEYGSSKETLTVRAGCASLRRPAEETAP